MEKAEQIKLTQTVQKGGCAAKVAAVELRNILKQVDFPPVPSELLVGAGTFDDAAIYKMNSEQALVQTLDFFTPIVDSPKIFGKIAAANALSDVYAMGGKPLTAMAIFAFPLANFHNAVAVEILQGACEVIKLSGASLVGGHTIDDDTLKFGLSVTGLVHPNHIWSNSSAQIGDDLILTKPIGTGTITAALKRKEIEEKDIPEALESMSQLNDISYISQQSLWSEIHAATDITGFGLAGHSYNLARASQVSLRFFSQKIPLFPQTRSCLEKGFLTKAHRTNQEYVANTIQFLNSTRNNGNKVNNGNDSGVSEGNSDSESSSNSDSKSINIDENKTLQNIFYDPQTSGGLLLSVSAKSSHLILKEIRKKFPFADIIGRVESSGPGGTSIVVQK